MKNFKNSWHLENAPVGLKVRKVKDHIAGRNLKRVNRMDLKICPKCKKLPDVEMRKRGIFWYCVIFCHTLGCKLYWPIVTVSLIKERAMKKAAARWNKAVDELEKGIK